MKKTLLSIGVIGAVATPIAAVISCNSNIYEKKIDSLNEDQLTKNNPKVEAKLEEKDESTENKPKAEVKSEKKDESSENKPKAEVKSESKKTTQPEVKTDLDKKNIDEPKNDLKSTTTTTTTNTTIDQVVNALENTTIYGDSSLYSEFVTSEQIDQYIRGALKSHLPPDAKITILNRFNNNIDKKISLDVQVQYNNQSSKVVSIAIVGFNEEFYKLYGKSKTLSDAWNAIRRGSNLGFLSKPLPISLHSNPLVANNLPSIIAKNFQNDSFSSLFNKSKFGSFIDLMRSRLSNIYKSNKGKRDRFLKLLDNNIRVTAEVVSFDDSHGVMTFKLFVHDDKAKQTYSPYDNYVIKGFKSLIVPKQDTRSLGDIGKILDSVTHHLENATIVADKTISTKDVTTDQIELAIRNELGNKLKNEDHVEINGRTNNPDGSISFSVVISIGGWETFSTYLIWTSITGFAS